MDPIQINLSAPIYGSNGTGVVSLTAGESVEAPDSLLVALTRAFKRKLAQPGPHGDVLRVMFGNHQYQFVDEMPVGYTHIRFTRNDGRRDIRVYGHPSGPDLYYDSAVQFLPHVVAMLVRSDLCYCCFCHE